MDIDVMMKQHFYVHSTIGVALCYCYFVSSIIPKGLFRLISLLPICYLFAILPLYLPISSVFYTLIFTAFLTWLANFKLFLFAFGQGPLSTVQSSKSLLVFIFSAILPIQQVNPESPSDKRVIKLPVFNNLATQLWGFSVLVGLLIHYDQQLMLHPRIMLAGNYCMVFLAIYCVVGFSSFLARTLVGMELEPAFDEPYLSTSLQEFWEKRWNLAVPSTLRLTVYKPVRSALAASLGSHLASLVALLATFIVSGLMHELAMCYATHAKPSWEHTSFFVLHGICIVLEIVIKGAFSVRRWSLPWFISGPLTAGFFVSTSFWLIFLPMNRHGVDAKMLQGFRSLEGLLKKMV